jgi:hypothetical protein
MDDPRVPVQAPSPVDAGRLTSTHHTPEKRAAFAVGGQELRLTEAAVMLAVAQYLMSGAETAVVSIHPDGQLAKQFNIPEWLANNGFERREGKGSTAYGGIYVRGNKTLIVHPRSGQSDVSGEYDGRKVFAECKGGVINSKHNGQRSRARRGIFEVVGALLARPYADGRQIAAVPRTPDTERLAERLAPRCEMAGIEIALVNEDGSLFWATDPSKVCSGLRQR